MYQQQRQRHTHTHRSDVHVTLTGRVNHYIWQGEEIPATDTLTGVRRGGGGEGGEGGRGGGGEEGRGRERCDRVKAVVHPNSCLLYILIVVYGTFLTIVLVFALSLLYILHSVMC